MNGRCIKNEQSCARLFCNVLEAKVLQGWHVIGSLWEILFVIHKPFTRLLAVVFIFAFPGAAEAQQESDFFFTDASGRVLQDYTLTNNSDLFFALQLERPLTAELQRLSPGISKDSALKIGNFQFSMLVDGKLVYQSNLLPGAPRGAQADTATHYFRALSDIKNGTGSWSESYWNRFMRYGGDSVLTDGEHDLRMEVRAYVGGDKVLTSDLLGAGDLHLKVYRKPVIDVASVRLNVPKPYEGLGVSTEKFDVVKIKQLSGLIDAGVFKKISSIVVIKNGKLLIEEYYNGAKRATLHNTRSVGKSFASTMTGIAIREKYLADEYETLGSVYDLKQFQNYDPVKEKITIRDLLTMSSAFDASDENPRSAGNEENMYPTDDWVKFALDLPVAKQKPVGEWNYFTAGVVVLGDVLNRRVKGGLEKFANEKLFKPLGINNYTWQYTPKNVPNTAGGLQMNALDFAKYGQLYKNGGAWHGKQIIPKEWVQKSFRSQVKIQSRTSEQYGYLFWNKTFGGHDAFYCAGNGGNYIIVFKDQPLVIVITSTAYGQYYAHPQSTKIVSEYLLPAILR